MSLGSRKAVFVMLIQHATLLDGTAVDIRVGAQIEEVGQDLAARHGESVLDADGGTVIPGLHDHHVHLRSAAAALDSLRVGPPDVFNKDQLAHAMANALPGTDGWIRAVGYHESVAGDLDRLALDVLVPHIPVRVQPRSGAMWILNSVALSRVGLDDHGDGRLHSIEHGWSDALDPREIHLADLGGRLTALGVTGVTDATPGLGADDTVSLL